MILPTKHIRLPNSLLGISAVLLKNLNGPQTVTSLWGNVRSFPELKTFERFTLALDFLYAVGAVDFEEGMLMKVVK